MSDSTAQDNENEVLDVEDLEDPNSDGQYPNGWEDDDVFAYDYSAYIAKHHLGSVKELEQMLRFKGHDFRKKLQADLKAHPENWKTLKRPASLHSASLCLAEMLVGIPHPDRDQFHEIRYGHVYMNLVAMEKYLFPTRISCASCTRTQSRTSPEVLNL